MLVRSMVQTGRPPENHRIGPSCRRGLAAAGLLGHRGGESVALRRDVSDEHSLTFGLEAPLPLRAAFGELEAMFRPFVDAPDLGARTEVAWSSLHGLATLDRGGRLRPELRDRRLALLVAERLAAVGAARA
ncbi:hypothetical protein ACWESM_25175 [Nocardia sp. NPDC003999]